MKRDCPNCGAGFTRVVDTRERENSRRRRNACPTCGHKWWTVELDPEVATDNVISLIDDEFRLGKTLRRELRGKILKGVFS